MKKTLDTKASFWKFLVAVKRKIVSAGKDGER